MGVIPKNMPHPEQVARTADFLVHFSVHTFDDVDTSFQIGLQIVGTEGMSFDEIEDHHAVARKM